MRGDELVWIDLYLLAQFNPDLARIPSYGMSHIRVKTEGNRIAVGTHKVLDDELRLPSPTGAVP